MVKIILIVAGVIFVFELISIIGNYIRIGRFAKRNKSDKGQP